MGNRLPMSASLRGVLAGLACDVLTVGMMLPMELSDKPAALLGTGETAIQIRRRVRPSRRRRGAAGSGEEESRDDHGR